MSAVPHATDGLFCTSAPGAAVPHSTFGLFCFDVEAPVFNPDLEGAYDGFYAPGEWQQLLEREDEELLLICQAFIEIIRCR